MGQSFRVLDLYRVEKENEEILDITLHTVFPISEIEGGFTVNQQLNNKISDSKDINTFISISDEFQERQEQEEFELLCFNMLKNFYESEKDLDVNFVFLHKELKSENISDFYFLKCLKNCEILGDIEIKFKYDLKNSKIDKFTYSFKNFTVFSENGSEKEILYNVLKYMENNNDICSRFWKNSVYKYLLNISTHIVKNSLNYTDRGAI